jgi:hypothetical protein
LFVDDVVALENAPRPVPWQTEPWFAGVECYRRWDEAQQHLAIKIPTGCQGSGDVIHASSGDVILVLCRNGTGAFGENAGRTQFG